jgi:hypothetical protein
MSMMDVLSEIDSAFNNNATLKSKLPVYTGNVSAYKNKLSIFENYAPKDAGNVYAIFNAESNPSTSRLNDMLSYTLEIYDVNISPVLVFELAHCFENVLFGLQGSGDITYVDKGNEGIVSNGDIGKQHYHISFYIKYNRTDLYI